MALPPEFPYRDLILLTAFSVVVGTLVIQGLTLSRLMRWLELHDDDPVAQEVHAARERALKAALASFAHERSSVGDAIRQELSARLGSERSAAGGNGAQSLHDATRRRALQAARKAILDMRGSEEIGDDAFHQMEEELDWLEMAGGRPDR
jgi:CPA1 family monovalent cation:H+ antiporter